MRALTRRTLIAEAAALAAASAVPASAATKHRTKRKLPALLREGAFSHGVASGHPTRTAATLWTRVGGIEQAGYVELELSRDADFRSVLRRDRVRVAPVRDFTVHHRVGNLKPGERYFYRFTHPGADSAVGRFTTMRPSDSRETTRIGFFSCQRWQDGYYTAHAGLAQEDDLDLVVALGDYIYETNATSSLDGRADQSSKSSGGQAETLADYRAKYALYRGDANLQAMHAAHPVMVEWDDHEVENNWAGTNPGTTAQSKRTIGFEARKRNGKTAFFEWLPVERVKGDPDPNRIYRSLPIGANAELFMLDTRSFRDRQPCFDTVEAQLGCSDEEMRKPGRTILGAAQKKWLLDRLSASPATWKVVANQVMMMGYDGLPGRSVGNDKWDGYAAERGEVLQTLLDRGVKDVTFITGDVHDFYAGVVTTTGRLDGTPAATEFVGGSITSASTLTDEDRASDEAQRVLEVTNPQWKFANFADKGYGVLEASADKIEVAFRAPATVATPTSPMRTLARFRVERGSTDVVRL